MDKSALTKHPQFWPVTALVALLLADLLMIPGFFSLQFKNGHLYGGVIDIINHAAPLILVALGMTLVIATRGIDISVGAVLAISAAVSALLVVGTTVMHDGVAEYVSKQPLWVAIAAALGVAALCGVWNALLVTVLGLQPIIATLILMVAGRGIAQLLTDGQVVTVNYQPYFFIGGGFLFGLPFAIYIALAVFLCLQLLMHKTALGLFIKACGINSVAARLAGIRTGQLIFSTYVFCSVCAGIAGLMVCSNVKSADAQNAGLMIELDAILAITLGGTKLTGGHFSLIGSVIGALIIQTLTYSIYSLGVPPEVNMVVKSVVVFVVCLTQSPEFRSMISIGGKFGGAHRTNAAKTSSPVSGATK
jgi:simple sugar transport system permease protein